MTAPEIARARTRAALIPVVVAPDVTVTGVGVPDVGWSLSYWSRYPVASEDPPAAPEAAKHTW